jgi:hypothetical protein
MSSKFSKLFSNNSPLLQRDPIKKNPSKSVKNIPKKRDPDTFTKNYNAATGMYHESMVDDGGQHFTPGYQFSRADQYKKNAIKKYGSLKASRARYKNIE